MTATSYLVFWLSLVLNIFFIFQYVNLWIENKVLEQEQLVENQKVYFTDTLFSDSFALKDYSATKFTLEQEGKDIITNAREFHSSPALIKGEAYKEAMCSAYVFELSRKFWDPSAPYMIGMMEQNTKTVADAWQLPYSYEYVGWKILADFTWGFSLQDKDYWKNIDTEKLKDFFATAFSEEALLWDIWFLYKNTEFLHELEIYKNANSHIAKNVWVSKFTKTVQNPEWKSTQEIISDAFACDTEIFPKMQGLLSHYEIYLDDARVVVFKGELYVLSEDGSIGEKAILTDMSQLSLQDITLMHFYKWAKVQSLFEMSCQGDFFPINILQINPRFIEKI